jgi:hypothetical protein
VKVSNACRQRDACWRFQETHVSWDTGSGLCWCCSGLSECCAEGERLQAIDCLFQCQSRGPQGLDDGQHFATHRARFCSALIDLEAPYFLRHRTSEGYVDADQHMWEFAKDWVEISKIGKCWDC